jgi:predicted RNA-binding protein YlxR (DUF448 family)
MVRIAASGDAIVLDPELSIAGRGGYLHIRSQCLEGFVKAKVREFRSLRRTIHRETRLKIVEEIRTRLDREAVLE